MRPVSNGDSLHERYVAFCLFALRHSTHAPVKQLEESKAMRDLNARIRQLTKLILTSQTVDENKGDQSRPGSPSKVDFDMTPYQVSSVDAVQQILC